MVKRRLSQHQKNRISSIQARRRQNMEQRADKALHYTSGDIARAGQVVTRHGQSLVIKDSDGGLYHCLTRQNIGHPVCGDDVVWQPTTTGQGVVTALLERTTALIRPDYSGKEKPLAANISQLIVVLAAEPAPSRYLLDQYLVTAETISVRVVIALNKKDLLDSVGIESFRRKFGYYQSIGYPLIEISAKEESRLDPLIDLLADKASILVGQSGVGKSSLVKKVLPDISIQIGRLSRTTGLGCHTTSASTLYTLPNGGLLIDSPGVRSFRLRQLEQKQLEQGFREFSPFLGACRFNNCRHKQEPGCALVQAVADGAIDPGRLENYRHLASNNGHL